MNYLKIRTVLGMTETAVLMYGIMILNFFNKTIEISVSYENENKKEGFDLHSNVSYSSYVQSLVKR